MPGQMLLPFLLRQCADIGMRICLTGGIACGKSLLSSYLRELGVDTIDADDIVHEIIPTEERRRLAVLVFSDFAARKELEARIHPLVRRRIADWFLEGVKGESIDASPKACCAISGIASSMTCNPSPAIRIAIIPLLFEVHWERDYDIIICVASSREKQIERMTTMRGYSREEAEARLAAQMDVEEKAARSHYVIRNDGSPEQLKEEASRLVARLKEQTRP